MTEILLFLAISLYLLSAGALTISQMLRLKEMLEPGNQAVTPNEVNIRQ